MSNTALRNTLFEILEQRVKSCTLKREILRDLSRSGSHVENLGWSWETDLLTGEINAYQSIMKLLKTYNYGRWDKSSQ